MGNPLNILYDAVGWVVRQIYDVISPLFGASSGWTWALTIVLLVVLMRLVMVPLFIKQMHATRAMAKLAPQISELRKKYKNDKQTLQQETMRLYQENGVNPLMGCLPVVAQMPLWFALFEVLKFIAEWKPGQPVKYELTEQIVRSAQHASILGAHIADKVLFTGTLAVPLQAKIVICCATVISMGTTFLSVRQGQKRGLMPTANASDPMARSQRMMTYIMPLFALTGLYWPFGLVLYWMTSNIWNLGQQFVLARRYPYTPPAPVAGVSSPAGAPGLTNGRAKSRRSTPANGKTGPAPGKAAGNGAGKVPGGTGKGPGGAGRTASGAGKPADGLRARLSRKAPEPEPTEPEIKVVRQQPQRQSRSRRRR